jgi:hypothetical protein
MPIGRGCSPNRWHWGHWTSQRPSARPMSIGRCRSPDMPGDRSALRQIRKPDWHRDRGAPRRPISGQCGPRLPGCQAAAAIAHVHARTVRVRLVTGTRTPTRAPGSAASFRRRRMRRGPPGAPQPISWVNGPAEHTPTPPQGRSFGAKHAGWPTSLEGKERRKGLTSVRGATRMPSAVRFRHPTVGYSGLHHRRTRGAPTGLSGQEAAPWSHRAERHFCLSVCTTRS